MRHSTPTQESSATWAGTVHGGRQRRKLVIATVLLLTAITAVLVRNSESRFRNDNDEAAAAGGEQSVSVPSTGEQAPDARAAEVKMRAVTKHSAGVTPSRTPSRHAHGFTSDSLKSQIPHDLRPTATWGPAKTAAGRARTSVQAQAHQQAASYPLLTRATAVQGSVLLQALIGADGAVQELRVISGPTILVSAARQAVQQWRFKPYLLNGKPVETYARVTVSFTIDVSNNEARYHLNSVTSTGAL